MGQKVVVAVGMDFSTFFLPISSPLSSISSNKKTPHLLKMAEENRVTFHGFWSSAYVKRVELVLKIKGIPYDYEEEDLRNKSAFLLQNNPVYKKVPVLVHNGKPIVESLVILEYIDETWKDGPRLLPQDPYQRGGFRFWAAYIQQLNNSIANVFNSDGKNARDKACEDMFEKLDVLEDGIKHFISEDQRSKIVAEDIDLLDIMIVASLGTFRVHEEVFGIEILNPHKHPFISKWVRALMEIPVVQETLPPHDKFVSLLQRLKQHGTKIPTN